MRLFTAIELPAATRDHLAAVIDTLRAAPALRDAASFTRPENLHVTLKFLGEVDDRHLPNLTVALRKIEFPTLRLAVERFLVLPGRGPARVLATALTGDDLKPLAEMFDRLEATVQPLGIRREGRPFKPHVTLLRVKRPSLKLTANTLARLIDPGVLPAPAVVARQGTLFKSTLTPTGPLYEAVARFPEVVD